MTEEHLEASVPVEELKELVEEWREMANELPMDTDHDRALRYSIDELQEVVDRYE